MDIVANVKDNEQFISSYLRPLNGILGLTDKELDIIKEFVKLYLEYKEGNVKEPFLSEMVFSDRNVRDIKSKLNISKQNWSNYKGKLIEKKALREKDEQLFINPYLLPEKVLTFKFIINE